MVQPSNEIKFLFYKISSKYIVNYKLHCHRSFFYSKKLKFVFLIHTVAFHRLALFGHGNNLGGFSQYDPSAYCGQFVILFNFYSSRWHEKPTVTNCDSRICLIIWVAMQQNCMESIALLVRTDNLHCMKMISWDNAVLVEIRSKYYAFKKLIYFFQIHLEVWSVEKQ